MTVKVSIKSKLKSNIAKGVDIYEENTIRHLNRVANMFQVYITTAMYNSTGGRTYRVSKREGEKGFHTASIKGNPPAVNTNRLVNSIIPYPATFTNFSSRVETNVEYAKFLEDETGLDRPFMSERSAPYKQVKKYANEIAKDISIGKGKILWAFTVLMFKQYYILR